MSDDRLYDDVDVELVASALSESIWGDSAPDLPDTGDYRNAEAVLETLTVAGWRPHAITSTIAQANQTRANTRAQVAEEIAQALDEFADVREQRALEVQWDISSCADESNKCVVGAYRRAAEIAREVGGTTGEETP